MSTSIYTPAEESLMMLSFNVCSDDLLLNDD